MLGKRLIKSNDAGGGACINTVDLYNPFPDGGGVALYQLNGDATDVSGNYDGTATNVTYGTGQFGQAGVFNGSSSKILASVPKSSSQSFSFWTKHGTQSNSTATYLGYSNTASNGFFSLCISSGNFSILYWNGTTYARNTSTTSITDNTWHHVVLNTVGNVFTIYLDGNSTPVYTTTLSGFTHATRSDLQISFETPDGAASYFNGSIDQVRIFSRALRPYEVEALYTEEYCTPTIVPSEHFNTVTYTGNGGTQSITGVGFQPDFTWIKVRTNTDNHVLQDSVRGVGKGLFSDLTNAENASMGGMTSFDSDGFTFDGSISTLNGSGRDFVAWNFKAGGAAVTNTDGTITSQVSANTEAGFSIVSYTGNGTQPSTIGHGLDSAPKIVINKCRSLSGTNWHVYSSALGATSALVLNDTAAAYTGVGEWGSNPDSSVLYVNNTNTNNSGRTYVSYCFAEVEGFSNFGSYVGTGVSGNTIVTGFEPAFAIFKRVSSTSSWFMIDNKRNPSNPRDLFLNADTNGAEYVPSHGVEFLKNGFSFINTDLNGTGQEWIYMAFAADPTAVEPTLEDSFNTVLYTGNGSTGSRSITGVGFQPDFVWTKPRTNASFHGLHTTIQGKPYQFTNLTAAEQSDSWYNAYGWVSSYDSDGFTFVGGSDVNNGTINASGIDYVAWAWKGAEIPAINSNGSIPSVVSANPAAGFSIVSWSGNSSTATIGHGLNSAPKMIISKDRNFTERWNVFHASVGTGKYLSLETSNAAISFANAWPTLPDENVWYMSNWENATGHNYISYVFAEVAGFSKFGSYVGNDTSQTIVTGFEPAFLMIKLSSAAGGGWAIIDNKRDTTNPRDAFLRANTSEEESNISNFVNFNSDGFSFISSVGNGGGYTFIYMAFANQF